MSMGNLGVLGTILADKRREVELLALDQERLQERALAAPPPRDFLAALRAPGRTPVIAEIKKRSPSAGDLAIGIDPARQAALYQEGGAAALSVLCDAVYFGGSLDDLSQARAAVDLPVLCKDFILHPAQVFAARAAGADAVLLIVAALEPPALAGLYDLAGRLGMSVLVEIHHHSEVEAALALDPPLVGINNRDLTTLKVDLEHSLRVRALLPSGLTVVAESGVSQPQEVSRLLAGGLDAFLVGTSLMRAADPVAALKGLVQAGEGA